MSNSPAVLANNTHILVGGTDLSNDLNQVAITFTQREIETTTFGTTGAASYIVSVTDTTFDLTGFFNKATGKSDQTFFNQLFAPGASVAVEADVPNNSTGSIKYTAQAWLKTYKPDAKVNDAVKITANFRVTDAVTRAVI